MPILECAAGRIAYFDNAPVAADAPIVMLLHSSSASGQQWRRLIGQLTPRYRVLAPDLIGYGSTPMTPAAPVMTDEIALLTALADAVGQPIHLIGHSYGGALALELARCIPQRIRSLALYEPTAFALLRFAGRHEAWTEIATVAQRHIRLVEMGDIAGAAVAFLDYWVGKGALLAMPEAMRAYIIRTMRKVAAEWRMTFAAEARPGDYAALTMPVLLLAGEATNLAVRSTAEVLRTMLPGAEWRLLAGLAHMAPLNQPDQVNPLFCAFLEAVSGMGAVKDPELRRAAP